MFIQVRALYHKGISPLVTHTVISQPQSFHRGCAKTNDNHSSALHFCALVLMFLFSLPFAAHFSSFLLPL